MRRILLASCLVAGLGLAQLPGRAQPPGATSGPAPAGAAARVNAVPPGEAEDSGADSPLGHLALAQELFSAARQSRDPVLAIAALRLASSVQSHDVERKPVEQTPGRPSAKTSSLDAPDLPQIASLARQLAGTDPMLLSQAERARQVQPGRGRVAGPGLMRSRIEASGKLAYMGDDTTFKAGELAQILLTGDGDADLDLYVTDELGNEVCRSDGPTDREYCSWTPRWTGRFRITIINTGTAWNSFSLRTN